MEANLFYRFLLVSFLGTWLATLQLQAQDYPEFEGVYVFDEATSQWMSVKPKSLELYQLALSTTVAHLDANGLGYFTVAGLSQSTLGGSPSVADTLQMRIFIRSRNPQLVFVDTIVRLSDLAATIPPGESATPDRLPPGSIRHKPAPDFVLAPYGLSADAFNAKLVDSTSSEYVLDLSNPVPRSVFGLTQCQACLMAVQGFAISTIEVGNAGNSINRLIFQTHSMGTD
jgi:hypothetical protein